MIVKRSLGLVVLIAFVISSGFAQEPQLAYRILTGYVEKKEATAGAGRRIGGGILTATGGLMIGAAATTWCFGDAIAAELGGGAMDPDLRFNLSLGLGLGGLATTGIGIGILASRPKNYRAEYAEVFTEVDPQIQEALAVAALRNMAVQGKKNRITGALSSLLAPVIYSAIKAGVNVSQGKAWDDDILSGLYWNAFSITGGITSLFSESEEERLYDKYLVGRDALYGDRGEDGN